jgi:NADH dehydrogenase
MLAEGVAEAAPPTPDLPAELRPSLPFSDEQIRVALPPKGGFGFADLRLARRSGTIVE